MEKFNFIISLICFLLIGSFNDIPQRERKISHLPQPVEIISLSLTYVEDRRYIATGVIRDGEGFYYSWYQRSSYVYLKE